MSWEVKLSWEVSRASLPAPGKLGLQQKNHWELDNVSGTHMSNIEYSLEGARSDVTMSYKQSVLAYYSPHLEGLTVREDDIRAIVSSSKAILSHHSLCGLLLREAENGAAALDDMVVK